MVAPLICRFEVHHDDGSPHVVDGGRDRAARAGHYPSYDVHIIVDSQQDESWQAIEAARPDDAHGRMHVQVLAGARSTCSLKNSALLQVVQSLDDSYEVLAFFDGDAAPHRDWLRDMVAPLAELQALQRGPTCKKKGGPSRQQRDHREAV